ASTGMSSSSATAGATKQFNVSSATKVADQCSSGSAPASNPGPTSRSRLRVGEVMLASLQTAGTGSTGSTAGSAGAGTTGQSSTSTQTTPGTGGTPGTTTNPGSTATPGTAHPRTAKPTPS